MNSILKVNDSYSIDESIANYETYAFYPITGTQLNNPGSITVTVQNSDNWYHVSNSWLEFEGQLKKSGATGGNYGANDLITFANNGILYLFDNIKYLLSSTEIESVFNPGTVSNILGLASNSTSFSTGLIQCWAQDTDNNAADTNLGFKARRSFVSSSAPIGSFRFAVPLSHILGFAQDYERVLFGFTHTLVLTRSSSDSNALFRKTDTSTPTENVPNGQVNLTQIRWMLPRVSPSDVARYELLKQIKAETILNVGFRMRQCISTSVPDSTQFTWRLGVRSSPEQPRYIFLAFQTDRAENQEKNFATYDHCNLTSAHALLNNDRYPCNDFTTDFAKNHYDFLYHEFSSFIQKFYKVDKLVTNTMVDPLTYKSLYPIVMFDVSRQSERLKSQVTDITLRINFSANPTAKTVAHVIMISDRKLRFKSDGEKMSVLF